MLVLKEYSGRKIKFFKMQYFTVLAYLYNFFLSTAEAVLQKMDDMKKMRRRRMRGLEDLTVFNETEEVNIFFHRGDDLIIFNIFLFFFLLLN